MTTSKEGPLDESTLSLLDQKTLSSRSRNRKSTMTKVVKLLEAAQNDDIKDLELPDILHNLTLMDKAFEEFSLFQERLTELTEADDEQEKAEQYSAELIEKQCIHGRVMTGLKKLKNKAEAYSGVLALGKTLKPLESVSPPDYTVGQNC